MNHKYLFANGDLQDWLRARLGEARKAVQGIPPDTIVSVPEPDLMRELVDRYSVNPPRLNLGQPYSPGTRDIKVDISGDPYGAIRNRSRPFYVPGTRVEVRVPFDRDAELFRLRPSTFITVFSRGGVEGQELVVW